MQMPQTENRQIPKDRIEDRKIMKRIFLLFLMSLVLLIVTLTGCGRLEKMDRSATTPAPVVVVRGETVAGDSGQGQEEDETEPELQI